MPIKKRKKTPELVELVRQRRANGVSWHKISNDLGIGRHAIKAWVDPDYRARENAKSIAYGKKHKERLKTYAQNYRATRPVESWARAVLSRIQQNQIEHDITADYLIDLYNASPKVCPVFGTPFTFGNGINSRNTPSVDRFNSTRGYFKDNISIISWQANRVKNNSTLNELKQIVRWMENKLSLSA